MEGLAFSIKVLVGEYVIVVVVIVIVVSGEIVVVVRIDLHTTAVITVIIEIERCCVVHDGRWEERGK